MSLRDIKQEAYRLQPPVEATESPLEARAAAISEALNDPFIDRDTACELIDELAEIEIKLEKE